MLQYWLDQMCRLSPLSYELTMSSENNLDSSILLFSPVAKGGVWTVNMTTSPNFSMHWDLQAMNEPCQLIRRGWCYLLASPYVFFHPETKSSWNVFLICQTGERFQLRRPPISWRAGMKSSEQHTHMSSTSRERSCCVTVATENTTGMLKR